MKRPFGIALGALLLAVGGVSAGCAADGSPADPGSIDGGADAGSIDGGADGGCLDLGPSAPGAPELAPVEPVLAPLAWTTKSLFPLAANELSVAKPEGSADSIEFVIDQPTQGSGLIFVELFAEAVASSDRVLRFAWRYAGRRDFNGNPTSLRFYTEGPGGRTAITVFDDLTEQEFAHEGVVSLSLHAGYPFGIYVVDTGGSTIETAVTLTTLESRPLTDPPSPAPAAGGCPTDSATPNQAPLLTLGPNLAFDTDPQPYLSLRWADLAAGPEAEAGQQLFTELAVLGTTGTLAFDAPPTLDAATGDLRLAVTKGTYGTATLKATLRDDGGTANAGVDTTTGTFTVRVNSPPVSQDVNIKVPWKTECVPVTFVGNDVDPRDYAWIEITKHPTEGFLGFGANLDTSMRLEVTGTTSGWNHAATVCYTPVSSTFVGFDSFNFRFLDGHGAASAEHAVTIEMYEL